MNILAILGVGATLYQLFKPKDPVDKITDHAMLLTGQMVSHGVPVAQAVKVAAATAVDSFAKTGQLPTAQASPWAGIPGIATQSLPAGHTTAWNVTARQWSSKKPMFQQFYTEAEANTLADQWRLVRDIENVMVTRVD